MLYKFLSNNFKGKVENLYEADCKIFLKDIQYDLHKLRDIFVLDGRKSWAQKSLQMVTAAIKLKDAPLMKNCDKPRQHVKKQRQYFADKGPSSQNYNSFSSHVWM